jgi:hypothetical protein
MGRLTYAMQQAEATMEKRSVLFAAFFAATLASLCSAPAFGQATRTWVSGVGDDANPCSRTAPCKTFAGAISKTAAGGEINCLDSGGFGAVTITKSITIYCEGVVGGLLAAGSNGVVVNAGVNDIVTLRGLDIDGVGTGLIGIRFLAGAALHVQDCQIRNFRAGNAMGIDFVPAGASELYVSNTVITGSGSTGSATAHIGIQVRPTATGSAKVLLTNVQVENNLTGFRAESTSAAGTINATIVDSTLAGSTANALVANAPAGMATVQVMVDQSAIVNNAGVGIRGDGAGATVRIANSEITGNATGSNFTNGAAFQSYGNNRIDGNNNNGPNPAIIQQK